MTSFINSRYIYENINKSDTKIWLFFRPVMENHWSCHHDALFVLITFTAVVLVYTCICLFVQTEVRNVVTHMDLMLRGTE